MSSLSAEKPGRHPETEKKGKTLLTNQMWPQCSLVKSVVLFPIGGPQALRSAAHISLTMFYMLSNSTLYAAPINISYVAFYLYCVRKADFQ